MGAENCSTSSLAGVERVAESLPNLIGQTGAASGLGEFAAACLAIHHGILPPKVSDRTGQPWLHDKSQGPRQAVVRGEGTDGSRCEILITEFVDEPVQYAVALPGNNVEDDVVGGEPLVATLCEDEAGPPIGTQSVQGGAFPRGAWERGGYPLASSVAESLFLLSGDVIGGLLDEVRRLSEEIDGSALLDLARRWRKPGKIRLACVARTADELREQLRIAEDALRKNPGLPFTENLAISGNPITRDRVFYSPRSLAHLGKLAYVYPGSGNHFEGMGRDFALAFPEILRKQHEENELLRSQYAPDICWSNRIEQADPRTLLFCQVAVGTLVSDLLFTFGIRPEAVIGYSLGESASMFGTHAWRGRDEMLRRILESSLFTSDLAPPYNAARVFWKMGPDEKIDWVTGVIAAPASRIREHLQPGTRAYLLIVNTPGECVIGGLRADVDAIVRAVQASFWELTGVTTAHCEVTQPVIESYRKLHFLPTIPLDGVYIYSGAWGDRYKLTADSAADSITAALHKPIDFPKTIEAAYRDGARIFVEIGPGSSCTRMIDAILGERPHAARALCVPRQDNVSLLLRTLAHLYAEGIDINLAPLEKELPEVAPQGTVLHVPISRIAIPAARRAEHRQVPGDLGTWGLGDRGTEGLGDLGTGGLGNLGTGGHSRPGVLAAQNPLTQQEPSAPLGGYAPQFPSPQVTQSPSHPAPDGARLAGPLTPAIEGFVNGQLAVMQAHEVFLRISTKTQTHMARLIANQTALLQGLSGTPLELPEIPIQSVETPRSLTLAQCQEFAAGSIGKVFGPQFAEIDAHPTRVRLPDRQLMLVDRMLRIEGEAKSLTQGRVVTEHEVRGDRWYLDAGRIPTCMAVEAGQADLFLSGYLGIDFVTRGLAVYRLLDAVVTFHRPLPQVGEMIRYDIRIDSFFRQGAYILVPLPLRGDGQR